MDKLKLIEQVRRINLKVETSGQEGIPESVEFLRIYSGENSSFYRSISKLDVNQYWNTSIVQTASGILLGFLSFLENDLHNGISLERKAQIETVSDLLEQANILLDTQGIHPAVPIIITGAALEEFLRNWVESLNLMPSAGSKLSLDVYANILKENDLLDKQDGKDITSWAGLRNSSAHGEWDSVNDKGRARNMLEGVNLFMRKNINKN